jgi:hypothetical protein
MTWQDFLITLTPYEVEAVTERAAIMEYDGGMSREDAEAAVMLQAAGHAGRRGE